VSPTTHPIHVTRADSDRPQGLYYYLGSVVDLSDDPEVHFKYIQAATRIRSSSAVHQINREKKRKQNKFVLTCTLAAVMALHPRSTAVLSPYCAVLYSYIKLRHGVRVRLAGVNKNLNEIGAK
jgi:hypothetical protein